MIKSNACLLRKTIQCHHSHVYLLHLHIIKTRKSITLKWQGKYYHACNRIYNCLFNKDEQYLGCAHTYSQFDESWRQHCIIKMAFLSVFEKTVFTIRQYLTFYS